MFDPNSLLEHFFGPGGAGSARDTGSAARQKLDNMGMGGFGGGALSGGILGLLLGNKKMRKMAGGAMGYGGAAAAGAMAYKAYQNWQQGQTVSSAPLATQADIPRMDRSFMPEAAPAADGLPFELILIRAMIAAAKADGHIDAKEQVSLFAQVEKMGLDAESKAFVFDALTQPVDLSALAAAPRGIEQATEIYLMSRLAIDVDHPAERAYLEALGHKLKLPGELVAHLDRQVEAGLTPQ